MTNKAETFKSLEEKAKKATTIKELFSLWKEAHQAELDDCKAKNCNTIISWDKVKYRTVSENNKKNTLQTISSIFETETKYIEHMNKRFCLDGIIDSKTYNQSLKVLFVSNEANIISYEAVKNEEDSRIECFVDYYNSKSSSDPWRGKMRERICSLYKTILLFYAYYIITSPIKMWKDDLYSFSKSFAFINLNKHGGDNTIGDGSHLNNYCQKYHSFIQKEIELINPDLIIWLGKSTHHIATDIFNSNNNMIIINSKKIPVISTWHPSYTQIKNMTYEKDKDNLRQHHPSSPLLRDDVKESFGNLTLYKQALHLTTILPNTLNMSNYNYSSKNNGNA